MQVNNSVYVKMFRNFVLVLLNSTIKAMENKPYHHLSDGTFRNPEGSPKRDENIKWSYKVFLKEKKKLDMTVPKNMSLIKKVIWI